MSYRIATAIAVSVGLVVTAGCGLIHTWDRECQSSCYKPITEPTPGISAMSIEDPCLDEKCLEPWSEQFNPMDLSEERIGESETLPLSLEQSIQMALSNATVLRDLGATVLRNPEAAGTIFDPTLIFTDPRLGQEAVLSEFDAQLSAAALFEGRKRGFNNTFVGDQGIFEQDFHSYLWGVGKRSATGASYNLRSVTDYDNNNQIANRLGRSTFDTFLEAEVRQPLLQGAGTEFNRIAGPNAQLGFINGVLIARTRQDISLAEFQENVRDLVADVENAYWDLYFAYRDLEAKIDLRDQALEIAERKEAQAAEGPSGGTTGDADQAREQYYRFQAEVVDALSGRPIDGTRVHNGSTGGSFRGVGGLRVAERRLRLMTGLEINDGRLIRPTDHPPTAPIAYDWNESISEALIRREEVRRQRWVIKQRELELIANRNFLKPQADLIGRYRMNGFGDRLISQGGRSNAARSFVDGEFYEWQAGVEVFMPVGFRQARAAVRNSQQALARERAILQEQERQIHFGLSNAFTELRRAYDNRQIQKERLSATEAQLEKMEQLDREGEGQVKAPLDVVLEAQRRLLDIRLSYHRAEIEYALALRNLQLEKGTLLEYCNVSLTESAWTREAYRDANERQRLRGVPHEPRARDPLVATPTAG